MSTSTQATKPKPTPGAANNSSWNAAPFAFAPNTNTMDPTTMPSAQAEAARQKSAAVMAALKRGDEAEANRLMGKENNTQGQLVPPRPLKWIMRKLTGGKKQEGNGVELGKEGGDSLASSVDRESIIVGNKKDDGVVR
ncbi:hypothetical protein DOTSEDRAFT_72245 [Dothistroma septosporum NZE10]|uniref:Uncharacterized protein n=1 Tax=Dothistroma septosporum (strain NZE10 / CBS 128990) TaxID=675120 RepID=N1PQL7_DOTSN|nr:hypothetical protein DOTSEDRAFT_72245 [Dothistroma septosporum NZE10]